MAKSSGEFRKEHHEFWWCALLLIGVAISTPRIGVAIHTSEFKNKSILVTGAGRGIGKRLALGFARLGAKIALVGRSKAEIDLAHIEIEQAGGNALRIRADVTDPEQLSSGGGSRSRGVWQFD